MNRANGPLNPWNQLLEALHSSLIDELVDRVRDPKPELGLPRRENSLLWPDPQIAELFCTDVDLPGSGAGHALIGLDAQATAKLELAAEQLWQRMLARAHQLEFPRRKLSPGFSNARSLPSRSPGAGDWPRPSRVIWIPFGLLPGRIYLGVGL